jgi:hypothetical protein
MRPVTKHISRAKQISDVKRNTLPSISRASSSHGSARPCCFIVLLRVLSASLAHYLLLRSGGDLSRSNSNPAKDNDVLLPTLAGATRLPDIACPCLHLGLPCAVRPVSLPASSESANPFLSGSHSLSFARPSLLPLYSVDHKFLDYRRSGLAPPLS